MKNTIISLSLALACIGCMSPTQPAERAGNPPPSKDRIAYLSDLKNCECKEKRVAMFIIPINYSADGNWEDFELKATTNNFNRGQSSQDTTANLLFYSQSEAATIQDNPMYDRMHLFMCTSVNPYELDIRAYTYVENTRTSEGLTGGRKPFSMVVLVSEDCLVRNKQSDSQTPWLVDTNEELIWVYMRARTVAGESSPEKDNDKTLWRPIAPVRWFTKLPNWAREQILTPATAGN